jgi:hypothetical protein
LIGWDASVSKRLKRRSIESGSGQTPKPVYNDLSTAQAFNLSLFDWARLPRIVKKFLHYKLAMDAFYQDLAQVNAQEHAEQSKVNA